MGNYSLKITLQPGRVATLVPHSEARTWGVAYKIVGNEEKKRAFQSLEEREINQGYAMITVDFTDPSCNESFQVAAYVTSPKSHACLKEVPMDIQVSA